MIELIKHCKSIAEFGGPSPLFEDIYKLFPNIDGFNLYDNNYWQKEFKETYKGIGKQYNCDVVNINIVGKKYDLILNSHVIEHIANPLQALRNWKEILNPGGYILSIIPDKSQMFDCKRPLTNLNHLIKDMFDGTEEDDETHIKEAVELFENNGCYDYENYIKSSKDNFKYRAIHHHCFNIELVRSMFSFLGFEVIYLNQVGMHIYTIAKCV